MQLYAGCFAPRCGRFSCPACASSLRLGLCARVRGPVRCGRFRGGGVPCCFLGRRRTSLPFTLRFLMRCWPGHSRGKCLLGRPNCCSILLARQRPSVRRHIKSGCWLGLMNLLRRCLKQIQPPCGTLQSGLSSPGLGQRLRPLQSWTKRGLPSNAKRIWFCFGPSNSLRSFRTRSCR